MRLPSAHVGFSVPSGLCSNLIFSGRLSRPSSKSQPSQAPGPALRPSPPDFFTELRLLTDSLSLWQCKRLMFCSLIFQHPGLDECLARRRLSRTESVERLTDARVCVPEGQAGGQSACPAQSRKCIGSVVPKSTPRTAPDTPRAGSVVALLLKQCLTSVATPNSFPGDTSCDCAIWFQKSWPGPWAQKCCF